MSSGLLARVPQRRRSSGKSVGLGRDTYMREFRWRHDVPSIKCDMSYRGHCRNYFSAQEPRVPGMLCAETGLGVNLKRLNRLEHLVLLMHSPTGRQRPEYRFYAHFSSNCAMHERPEAVVMCRLAHEARCEHRGNAGRQHLSLGQSVGSPPAGGSCHISLHCLRRWRAPTCLRGWDNGSILLFVSPGAYSASSSKQCGGVVSRLRLVSSASPARRLLTTRSRSSRPRDSARACFRAESELIFRSSRFAPAFAKTHTHSHLACMPRGDGA